MSRQRWFARGFEALAITACVATAVSAIHSNAGWIRVLDFPRTSMLTVIVVLSLDRAVFVRTGRWLTVAALFVAGTYQPWRIRDYTPLVGEELSLEASVAEP